DRARTRRKGGARAQGRELAEDAVFQPLAQSGDRLEHDLVRLVRERILPIAGDEIAGLVVELQPLLLGEGEAAQVELGRHGSTMRRAHQRGKFLTATLSV